MMPGPVLAARLIWRIGAGRAEHRGLNIAFVVSKDGNARPGRSIRLAANLPRRLASSAAVRRSRSSSPLSRYLMAVRKSLGGLVDAEAAPSLHGPLDWSKDGRHPRPKKGPVFARQCGAAHNSDIAASGFTRQFDFAHRRSGAGGGMISGGRSGQGVSPKTARHSGAFPPRKFM
jgi:hypothetical protein